MEHPSIGEGALQNARTRKNTSDSSSKNAYKLYELEWCTQLFTLTFCVSIQCG